MIATADPSRIAGLLRATSRTFALSIEGLPDSLRDQIALAYLLLRVSDYLEDHERLPAEEKARLLEQWEAVLTGEEPTPLFAERLHAAPHRADDPEATVALEHGLLLDALAAVPEEPRAVIIARVTETTRGMARWQRRGPVIENESQLDDYMHSVAGVVGYLVTDLFSIHFRSVAEKRTILMPLAREFGLALQCVNIIRGLRKDYERGWIYVPRSFCAAYDLVTTDLFCRAREHTAMRVVADLIAKAERHLHDGLEYVRTLPRHLHRLRLACMWPLMFAAKTIAISRDNPGVLSGEVKMSRDAVKRIVSMSTILGWSNLWVKGYTNRLLHGAVS